MRASWVLVITCCGAVPGLDAAVHPSQRLATSVHRCVGFTLISLFDGFVIVGAMDLGPQAAWSSSWGRPGSRLASWPCAVSTRQSAESRRSTDQDSGAYQPTEGRNMFHDHLASTLGRPVCLTPSLVGQQRSEDGGQQLDLLAEGGGVDVPVTEDTVKAVEGHLRVRNRCAVVGPASWCEL
jgi:hypothetical protein